MLTLINVLLVSAFVLFVLCAVQYVCRRVDNYVFPGVGCSPRQLRRSIATLKANNPHIYTAKVMRRLAM